MSETYITSVYQSFNSRRKETTMKKVILIMATITSMFANAALLDRTVEFIAAEENFSPTVYSCASGVRTIGYGFTDPALVAKGKITKTEATKILRARVQSDLEWVSSKLPHLTDNQKLAVTSLVYNIGRTRFIRSKAYKCLSEGKMLRALAEMAEFRLTDGKVSKGLVARRSREKVIFVSIS